MEARWMAPTATDRSPASAATSRHARYEWHCPSRHHVIPHPWVRAKAKAKVRVRVRVRAKVRVRDRAKVWADPALTSQPNL